MSTPEKSFDLTRAAKRAEDPATPDDERDTLVLQISVMRPKAHHPKLGDDEYRKKVAGAEKPVKSTLGEDGEAILDEDEVEPPAEEEEKSGEMEPAMEPSSDEDAASFMRGVGLDPDADPELAARIGTALRERG